MTEFKDPYEWQQYLDSHIDAKIANSLNKMYLEDQKRRCSNPYCDEYFKRSIFD